MTQRHAPAHSAPPAATRAAAAPSSPARADAVGPPAPSEPEAGARGLTATARAALAELPPCLAALGHLF
ncbi:MAG: CCA tRNA nucleotidyltransferase, partial [Actinomyces dentalis]